MSHFFSPLRYPGGKTCNYDFVVSLFEENNLQDVYYAEPYAGGAGLALKLLCTNEVSRIFLNDFDRSIYCFWKVILNYPEEFCSWIDKVEINVNNWEKFREIHNHQNQYSDMEIAQSVLFLNRCNVSGVIMGGMIGGIAQSGKYKMDARFNKKSLISKIYNIAEYKSKIKLYNKDGIEFIKKVNGKHNLFFYLDPPYYNKGHKLYLNFYNPQNHRDLAFIIESLKNHNWIMSYDNVEFIKELYKPFRKISYTLRQSTSNKMGDEILIFDDKLIFNKSKSLLANAFLIS